MNTENTVTSPNDDVVFENRNKAYGAYAIRRQYDTNLSKGSFASFLFIVSLFGMTYAAMMLRTEIHKVIKEPIQPKYLTDVIVIPDNPLPPEIKKHQIQTASTFPTKVVIDEVDDRPIDDTPITATTNDGDADGDLPVFSGDGPGIVTPAVPAIAPPQTLDIAEVMPEFEGGEKALYKFLRKTLRYPEVAKRIGEEGTVFVKFIIDTNGVITGIEIIKGVSAALDKEAIRVVSLMPRWKPGMQHGVPVNVRRVLPMKFEFNKD